MSELGSLKVVSKAALCLIPGERLWRPIQAIRAEHDKHLKRWMPHINLLYPFYEDDGDNFARAAAECARVCQAEQPVAVRLSAASFGSLGHGRRSATLVLEPDAAAADRLRGLQQRLAARLAGTGDRRFPVFRPHLSLGQFDARGVAATRAAFEQQWRADAVVVDWLVDRVCLISRADFDDPFHIKQTIHFTPPAQAVGASGS